MDMIIFNDNHAVTRKTTGYQEEKNVQTVHIHHTELLHSHLLYMIDHHEQFESLNATFQQNDCTSFSLPVTLCP